MDENKTENEIYVTTLKDSSRLIREIEEVSSNSAEDKQQLAELYGIYYNAFAGVIRSGMLFKRLMSKNGYPKVQLDIGEEVYTMHDSILKDILGNDYIKLAKYPYEDSSKSYVSFATTVADKAVETPSFIATTIIANNENELEREAKKAEAVSKAEAAKEKELLREKNRQLLKDAKKFSYDPNYDHFYDDELPIILKELDKSATSDAARIAGILCSVAGIVATLVLL
jgi:hypothetical protein